MNRPTDKLRPVADELAKLLCAGSTERDRMLALLEQLSSPAIPAAPLAPKAENTHVGIWKATVNKDGSTSYNRDPALLRDWTLWADVAKMPVRVAQKRIVLLGESVTRGYLYDPYYNLAKELSGILKKTGITDAVEITDLAKTNLLLEELVPLVPACMALKPDLLVIMAGNNWHYALEKSLDAEDLTYMRNALEKGDYAQLRTYVEEKFSRVITAALESIAEAAAQHNVPVIFVIPEFNLADWKSDAVEQIIPWAPDTRMASWLAASESAMAAQARGQKELLESAASLMIAADMTNPAGYELLAQCHVQDENWSAARSCLEQARDTVLFGRALRSKPRRFNVARRTILTEGLRLGMNVVDLQRVFEDKLQGGIPGRQYFLDYCHMSLAGIRLSMQHVAATVIEVMTGRRPAMDEIVPSGIEPSAEVQATAHFCAAIHNAHGGQKGYIMEYHCRRALALAPSIKECMRHFIDFASRHSSTKFCKSFSDIVFGGTEFSQYTRSAGLLHARNGKIMDVELADTMVNVLADAGLDLSSGIAALRMQEHAIGHTRKNLLESFYVSDSYNAFIIDDKLNYLQSRSTAMNVSFVAGVSADIELQLVYRTPGRSYNDKMIQISCNGKHVVDIPMSRNWATSHITIPQSCLQDGVNRLVIKWPYTSEPIAAGRAVLKSYFSSCYPVLGEVYTLTAVQPRSTVPQQPAISKEQISITVIE
jgi:hypothetical protein